MRVTPGLLALSAAISTASAAFQGFNYGNDFTDGRIKVQADFESEFKTAQGLKGTNGAFNSARLYTMVQGHTGNDVIEAIPAAIKTKTSLLLGLWASAGSETFDNEVTALKKAIAEYGDDLAPLVAGISVGSEDLYRASPVGVEAGEFAGLEPDTLVGYIAKVRDAIRGTALESAKIGHVDTWTAFVDGSNAAVIEACDWLGMDAYPYFEKENANDVSNGAKLFGDALRATQGAGGGGKEVWITETGWPVSGKTVGAGVPSPENAQEFWRDVGCPMFGETNVWWYTLQDAAPDTPNPSFGVIGPEGPEPLYDLSCEGFPTDDKDGDDDDDNTNGDGDDKDDDGNNGGGNGNDGKDDEDNGKDDNGKDDNGKDDNDKDDNDKDDNDKDQDNDNGNGSGSGNGDDNGSGSGSGSGSGDGSSDNDGSNSGDNSGTSNPPGNSAGGSDSRPDGGDSGSGSDPSSPGPATGTGSGSGTAPTSGPGADEGTQKEEESVETSSSRQLNSIGASVIAVIGAIALL